MKKYVLFFSVLFIPAMLYAEKLPTGDEVTLSESDFYPNKRIKSCSFTKPYTITTPAGKIQARWVEFYQSGKIKSATLSDNAEIKTPVGRVELGEYCSLSFYENGAIMRCTMIGSPAITTSIGKLDCGVFVFYEDGKIFICQPGGDVMVKDVNYNGKTIGFDKNGKFMGTMEWNDTDEKWIKAAEE